MRKFRTESYISERKLSRKSWCTTGIWTKQYHENPENKIKYQKAKYHENSENKAKLQKARYQENPKFQIEYQKWRCQETPELYKKYQNMRHVKCQKKKGKEKFWQG